MKIKDIEKIDFTMQDTKAYAWRMENDVIEMIDQLALENKLNPSHIVSYIIDWSCERMYKDEEFRSKILSLKIDTRKNLGKENYKMRRYLLSSKVNMKFEKTRSEIRFYNVACFVNESVRYFLKKY